MTTIEQRVREICDHHVIEAHIRSQGLEQELLALIEAVRAAEVKAAAAAITPNEDALFDYEGDNHGDTSIAAWNRAKRSCAETVLARLSPSAQSALDAEIGRASRQGLLDFFESLLKNNVGRYDILVLAYVDSAGERVYGGEIDIRTELAALASAGRRGVAHEPN